MILNNMIKITEDNINLVPEEEQSLLKTLLIDINEINNLLPDQEVSIYWQGYHDEYSPERVDPCPDYYGYYLLGSHNLTIGNRLSLKDLDWMICGLRDFAELIFVY